MFNSINPSISRGQKLLLRGTQTRAAKEEKSVLKQQKANTEKKIQFLQKISFKQGKRSFQLNQPKQLKRAKASLRGTQTGAVEEERSELQERKNIH